MSFHKNLTLDDVHSVVARVYTDIPTRNADTGFVVTENLDKIVRVDNPFGYHLLAFLGPTPWVEVTNTGLSFADLPDGPGPYSGQAGNVTQVNAAENALEFGQRLRTTDSPTFSQVTVGNTGLVVGTSVPFSDSTGVLTLQNIDVIDATTEAALEAAIDTLANLTSVQGQILSLSGPLTVEAASILNQDLTSDANPTFNDLVLTGDLIVQGTTTTLDSTTLLIEDKNIELGAVANPTDVTADGGGITLKGTTDITIKWLNAKNAWEFNQSIDLLGNNLLSTGTVTAGQAFLGNFKFNSTTFGSLAGDLDVTSASGGVFKFTTNAIRAGLDAIEYVEMGHGGGSGFINLVGDPGLDIRFAGVTKATFTDNSLKVGLDATNLLEIGHGGANAFIIAFGTGGLDFRFEGTTKATFTDAGHLHLLTDLDQRDILKLKTVNNLNDTGMAWEDANGSFTHTIFRTDTGNNQAGLVFAAGQNANVNLLTNSFIIHGATGVEGKLEVLGALQISNANAGLNKVLTSDALGLATWETALSAVGQIVIQETFASTNVRFFGELALPVAQGWTDTATGIATIDLVTQTVFGEVKQVVRHNDDTGGGSTTSKITLTTQNWIDINNFGASYSGTARLDTVNGASGFFSGLQANAAENPLATGNRRYGILFDSSAGNLKLVEADNNPGNSVTMDGTGGNPLVPFDEWFRWECVVSAGLGAAEVYINGILTTFVPTFIVNGGGLGTQIIVSSGSTGGANRIAYHDNFGVTIFEEIATKTLAVATMVGDVAQINIPEGKRDYTIILPDGNPRPIGSVLRLVANNLGGSVELQNENPPAPEILYNGLRTLVLEIAVKEVIDGVNTVNSGNVYIGFKAEDVDRASSIFAQLHSIIDQIPTDINPIVITYTNHDAINGIGHSTTINTGELEILPGLKGTYFVMAQPQVGKTQGATGVDFDMFLQINRGSGFVDEPNSNIKLTIKDQDITDVIVSAFSIQLSVGDKIRMMQKVSDASVGMGLKNTDPIVGPPTVPRTPSIIFTMYRIGGI